MAGLTEIYCGWNEPCHASQFKWLEYTFKGLDSPTTLRLSDSGGFSFKQSRADSPTRRVGESESRFSISNIPENSKPK